jgi:preprotein translocase subunit SecB
MSDTPTAAPAPAGQGTGPRQIVLQKIYLKDASLEIPLAPQIYTRNWQPQVDVQVTTSLQPLNAEQHQVLLTVTVTAKLEQEVAFLAEVQQAGIFLLKGMTDNEEKQRVLGTECPSILFPFARESVSELVQRGGFPQLLLQPIDFGALYQEHVRKEAAPSH